MLDLFFWIPVIIVTLVMLYYVVGGWWNSDPMRAFDSDYSRMITEGRQNGLSYRDMMDQWDVKAAFARIRSAASDAVRKDVQNWKAHLDKAIDDEVRDLAALDKGKAAMLEGMIAGVTYGDILYPEEAFMVDRLPVIFQQPRQISVDRMAALRVIR